METIHITTREAILYFALINAAVGFFLGLIPLCFGFFRGKKKLGVLGIISSTVGGAVLGIYLVFPIIATFMWLIIDNKLARVAISIFVTLVGMSLTVFAYFRHTSGTSEGTEATGTPDMIFLALMIGGIIFSVVGVVLIAFSFWSGSGSVIEESDNAVDIETVDNG